MPEISDIELDHCISYNNVPTCSAISGLAQSTGQVYTAFVRYCNINYSEAFCCQRVLSFWDKIKPNSPAVTAVRFHYPQSNGPRYEQSWSGEVYIQFQSTLLLNIFKSLTHDRRDYDYENYVNRRKLSVQDRDHEFWVFGKDWRARSRARPAPYCISDCIDNNPKYSPKLDLMELEISKGH